MTVGMSVGLKPEYNKTSVDIFGVGRENNMDFDKTIEQINAELDEQSIFERIVRAEYFSYIYEYDEERS